MMAWGEDTSMALGVCRVAYSNHQGYEGMPFMKKRHGDTAQRRDESLLDSLVKI